MPTSFTQFKKKVLADRKVRSEYEALSVQHDITRAIITHRTKRGWSQTELAEAIGTRQPVISRLERGEGNPSLRTLERIAEALDVPLSVSMG
jgi:ribosome-binding protein aMBF1 (putative translation factor)